MTNGAAPARCSYTSRWESNVAIASRRVSRRRRTSSSSTRRTWPSSRPSATSASTASSTAGYTSRRSSSRRTASASPRSRRRRWRSARRSCERIWTYRRAVMWSAASPLATRISSIPPTASGPSARPSRTSPTGSRPEPSDRGRVPLAEFVLENLAGPVSRQSLDANEMLWDLIAGEALPTEGSQVVILERRARVHYEYRQPDLVVLLVGYRDDRGVFDPGMVREYGLDLGGVDVLPAAADHVLGPPAEGEEPLFVDRPEVARPQPAVDEDVARGLRFLPIPGADRGA